MTALASTNVTIAVTRRITNNTKRRSNLFTMTFGDGALTYPAGGVPLPDYHSFGFARFMEFMNMQDAGSANGFLYKYDIANNKLRIYQGDNTNASAAPAVEMGAVAIAATTIKGEALGW